MTNEITQRYAQGMFELAKEEKSVEEKKKQAECILETMNDCPDFALFLRAVKVTKQEKYELIDRVFQEAVDHDMCSFMKLIIEKGRAYYMQGIMEDYVKLANEDLGIELAEVVSARKLSAQDMQTIGEALVRKTNKKIVLKNKIDPSVIGGIRVTMANSVTDATISAKIERMRSALLKGGRA
jgi:F-type H+-transporting ATPase subunit delta